MAIFANKMKRGTSSEEARTTEEEQVLSQDLTIW